MLGVSSYAYRQRMRAARRCAARLETGRFTVLTRSLTKLTPRGTRCPTLRPRDPRSTAPPESCETQSKSAWLWPIRASAGAPWHTRCDMRGRDAASRRELTEKQTAATPHISTGFRCRCLGGGIMSNLINFVKTFSNKEDGQDLLEYALLVALIALIAIGAVGMAGGSVSAIFSNIAAQLGAAA